MRTDMVEDEFFVHTRSGHGNDVARRDGAGTDLAAELLGNHRSISRLHFVLAMADSGAGECAYARPNRCTGAGMARRSADQRASASAE